MWNFFNSFAASTKFQRYRLEITTKTLDKPNEHTLRNMMKSFCSQDKETKAQIAYATITKKLLTSDSRNNWIYLLKNLIILDRVIEQGVFIEEISQAQFQTLENFTQTDARNKFLDSQRMIKMYWRLIKEKSLVLKTKKNIFYYKRSQRYDYLTSINATQTLKQIQTIQNFFSLTFTLIGIFSGKKILEQFPYQAKNILKERSQFTKSSLLQYLYLQMLHKLMLYYSCEMLACNSFIMRIRFQKDIDIDVIKRFRKCLIKFKSNSDWFINFVQENKNIKGFQIINYRELNPFEKDQMLTVIDRVLRQAETQQNKIFVVPFVQFSGGQKLKVEKRPSIPFDKKVITIPRLRQIRKRPSVLSPIPSSEITMGIKKNMSEANPFMNWINSYSQEFPQKEIMTVDLITLLKQENEDHQQNIETIQRSQNMVYYDLRDTNISVNFDLAQKIQDEKMEQQDFCFKNLYSSLPLNWNQDQEQS